VDWLFSLYWEDSEVSWIWRGEFGFDQVDLLVCEVVVLCREVGVLMGGVFIDQLLDDDGVLRFDLIGLVKGWVVERVVSWLVDLLVMVFCFNVGGDVVVGGEVIGVDGRF